MAAAAGAPNGLQFPDDRIEKWMRRRSAPGVDLESGRPSTFGAVRRSAKRAQSSPPASSASFEKAFESQLSEILFACGDVSSPQDDTVALLRDMICQFLESIVHLSLDHAATHDHAHRFAASNVVAALRQHDPATAQRVEATLVKKKELDDMLRIDITGKHEEIICYSRADPPAEFLTGARLTELADDLKRRAAFDAHVANGDFQILTPQNMLAANSALMAAHAARAVSASGGMTSLHGAGAGGMGAMGGGGPGGGAGAGGQRPHVRPPMAASAIAVQAHQVAQKREREQRAASLAARDNIASTIRDLNAPDHVVPTGGRGGGGAAPVPLDLTAMAAAATKAIMAPGMGAGAAARPPQGTGQMQQQQFNVGSIGLGPGLTGLGQSHPAVSGPQAGTLPDGFNLPPLPANFGLQPGPTYPGARPPPMPAQPRPQASMQQIGNQMFVEKRRPGRPPKDPAKLATYSYLAPAPVKGGQRQQGDGGLDAMAAAAAATGSAASAGGGGGVHHGMNVDPKLLQAIDRAMATGPGAGTAAQQQQLQKAKGIPIPGAGAPTMSATRVAVPRPPPATDATFMMMQMQVGSFQSETASLQRRLNEAETANNAEAAKNIRHNILINQARIKAHQEVMYAFYKEQLAKPMNQQVPQLHKALELYEQYNKVAGQE